MSSPQLTPGQFVIRRRFSRWAWASFEVGKLVKLTEKQAVVKRYRDERVPLNEIVAAFDDETAADQLKQALDGVCGTYRQKASAADAECWARKNAAKEAADKAAAALLAKAVQQ